MDRIATEEVMKKLDMFQSRFGKRDEFGWWGFGKNFSRCKYAIYLHGVQVRMTNLQYSFIVSRSGTPGNEWKSQGDIENVTYNYTLTYGTCESFGSIYSFCINVYSRFFPSTTNQIPDKQRQQTNRTI